MTTLVRLAKRRPDLAFVSAARWPKGRLVASTEAWHLVPDLAVEVISDSNGANEIVLKIEEYFKAGTREVWIIYPCVRKVYVYSTSASVRIERRRLKAGCDLSK